MFSMWWFFATVKSKRTVGNLRVWPPGLKKVACCRFGFDVCTKIALTPANELLMSASNALMVGSCEEIRPAFCANVNPFAEHVKFGGVATHVTPAGGAPA